MLKRTLKQAGAGLLTCVSLISGAAAANAELEFELRREQNTLIFKGEIGPESAQALIAQLDSGATLIVISSVGGSVKDALDVANAMRRHQVALQVQDYCFSSCANYLFVAAAEKKLMPGAVLGFHGGVYAKEVAGKAGAARQKNKQLESAMPASLESIVDESSAFYRSVGFDPELLSISYLLTLATAQLQVKIKLASDEHEYRFSSLDEAEVFLRNLPKSKTLKSMDVGRPSQKVYFPNQHMLIKYGVKGITAYPYPADQAALDALGKALELELIGDFAQQHQQSD